VEIVVVLLIFSVIVAMGAVITRAITAGQKRSLTSTRLAAIDAALVQYTSLQKRLPCPADGRKAAATDANAGKQIVPADTTVGCTLAEQRHGVVPWRDLGLTEDDIMDGWGLRITYRVFPLLSANNGADMTQCDPAGGLPGLLPGGCGAGNAATCCATCAATTVLTTCNAPIQFLVSRKGIEIRSMAGVTVMDPAATPPTGAAYALISAGETGGGGYTNNGVIHASTTNGNDSPMEQLNYADRAAVPAPDFYVDDTTNDSTAPNTHFDDVVLHPSVATVINKAGLGARAH
jgi:type II secretory pathway pseudopilin PulG